MITAIFDMDGTVLDSMGCWRDLNIAYVESQGIALTPALREEVRQLSGMQAVAYLEKRFHLRANFEELLSLSCEGMRKYYERGIPEKPGAKAYLHRLQSRGVRRVLATATPPDLARIALSKSGLLPCFDLITTTQEIGLEKSDPAFWLKAAALAGAQPPECTVYEDALYAIKGARLASMDVIAIEDETNLNDRTAIRLLCSRMITSYDELP